MSHESTMRGYPNPRPRTHLPTSSNTCYYEQGCSVHITVPSNILRIWSTASWVAVAPSLPGSGSAARNGCFPAITCPASLARTLCSTVKGSTCLRKGHLETPPPATSSQLGLLPTIALLCTVFRCRRIYKPQIGLVGGLKERRYGFVYIRHPAGRAGAQPQCPYYRIRTRNIISSNRRFERQQQ